MYLVIIGKRFIILANFTLFLLHPQLLPILLFNYSQRILYFVDWNSVFRWCRIIFFLQASSPFFPFCCLNANFSIFSAVVKIKVMVRFCQDTQRGIFPNLNQGIVTSLRSSRIRMKSLRLGSKKVKDFFILGS